MIVAIDGPAGGLETLLEESPAGSGAGFAVVCHPHPLHGGSGVGDHARVVFKVFD